MDKEQFRSYVTERISHYPELSYEWYEENPYEAFTDVFRFVKSLLSRRVRIRRIFAGAKPRKWLLEYDQDSSWVINRVIGSLFWNILAPRKEECYMNDILRPRKQAYATPA